MVQKANEIDVCVQQEVGAVEGRPGAAFLLLQLLPKARQLKGHTPAMEAGITDRVWKLEDLLA